MLKRTIAAFLILTILIVLFTSQGLTESGENIRIGLFYGSKSTNYFKMAAYSGTMELGYAKNGSYIKLLDYKSSDELAITRDTYYHIKIGSSHDTYESAQKVNSEFRSQDFLTYIAYTGAWEVWIGNFSMHDDGKTKAEEFIKNSIEGRFNYTTAILEPSSYGIVVLKEQDKFFALKLIGANLRINTKNGTDSGIFWLDGKRYRGNIEVARISGSDMTVINVLDIEDYLYGVLPYEMYSSTLHEALKAQAVAARTYAMRNKGRFGKYQFDLDNTTASQVYKGYDGEQKSTNQAVDATKGEVVTYNGNLAHTYYFSSSGGMTEDNIYVWSSAVYPYLTNVPDLYEAGNSTYYTWEYTYTASEIKDKLADRGLNVGSITALEVEKWSPAGRPYELVVEGSNGSTVIEKTRCRTTFGFPSQLYNIESSRHYYALDGNDRSITLMPERNYGISSDDKVGKIVENPKVLDGFGNVKTLNTTETPTVYKFIGRGWGHGIGLSQEGAKGMDKAGYAYDEILRHYYPGTVVN